MRKEKSIQKNFIMKLLPQISLLWTYLRSTVRQTLSTFSTRPKRDLLSLPTEILLLIADELPIESVVSCSLASKALTVILPQRAYLLSQDKDATYRFLQLIRRDMAPHLLCKACNKLFLYKIEGDAYIVRCPHMTVTCPGLSRWTLKYWRSPKYIFCKLIC
jgi:hypothetical protein